MEKLKTFICKNKKAVIVCIIIIVAAAIGVTVYFTIGISRSTENDAVQTGQQTIVQEVPLEELAPLEEIGMITGIKNRSVGQGTELNLKDFISSDNDIVKNIEINDSNVNYSNEGEYQADYTITFDGDKLNNSLKEHHITVAFDTNAHIVIIKVTTTITVMGEETSEEIESGNTEINTSQTENQSANNNNKEAAGGENNNPQQSASGNQNTQNASGSTNNSGNHTSAHYHTWVNHTTQVWVPNIVTIVDQPEQIISGARFYTMDASGSYIANGPTYWIENGFTYDDLKAIIMEGLRNADENGLYNGVYYGNYQNVTKTIPAVTHQEDQGYYEERVDYQYCSVCGQRK